MDDLTYLMPKISPKPLLMILAEQEHPALLAGQRSAYAAAGEPKSLLEVDGHHHSVYTDWKDVKTAAARDGSWNISPHRKTMSHNPTRHRLTDENGDFFHG